MKNCERFERSAFRITHRSLGILGNSAPTVERAGGLRGFCDVPLPGVRRAFSGGQTALARAARLLTARGRQFGLLSSTTRPWTTARYPPRGLPTVSSAEASH